ncbi:hypothetical protein HYU12_00985 [Candidatus Woesearchaeota archaeon]|nr:hypothetical protein [Candidatus Woesearchaeota archaeon]
MANVLPSLREKKRYLVFEVIGSDARCSEAVDALKSVFASFFGALEFSGAAIRPVRSSAARCVVCVNRAYVDKVAASLALVKKLKNVPVILKSVGVSGSLRAASSRYLIERGVM